MNATIPHVNTRYQLDPQNIIIHNFVTRRPLIYDYITGFDQGIPFKSN